MATAEIKPEITYEDFTKLDLRIGRIVEVKEFPRARNPSYKVAVEFADLGLKWSSAQITSYSIDELVGRQVICTVNMPPRNVAGFMSEVLIMGAANEAGDIILLKPSSEVVTGTIVY
ncbi:MAG: tRNA-binding protein [Alphaproteobacteria bacterium]